jgi:hypothetical protein
MADQEAYQSGIGNLLHMVQCIRSDIAAPGGALAAFCSAPTHARPSSMQFSTLAAQLNVVSPKATRPCPWRCGAIQSSCRALTQGRGSKVGCQRLDGGMFWGAENLLAVPCHKAEGQRLGVKGWMVECFGVRRIFLPCLDTRQSVKSWVVECFGARRHGRAASSQAQQPQRWMPSIRHVERPQGRGCRS